jgi:hypothetical protein
LLLALLAIAGWSEMSSRSTPQASSLLQEIMQAHPESDEYANAQALFEVSITQ